MVSYGEVLRGALRFALQPKRWLPFFVLDIVFFLAAVSLVMTNFSGMLNLLMTTTTSPAAALSLAGYAFIFIAGFIVWALLRLWITGAVLHQSVKPKEFRQSWGVANERFFSLLAVAIVVGIISSLVSMVPWIGWLLSIIAGIIFFFAMPAVVAKKLSFDNALRDSYKIFRKKPLTVFLIWLVVAIIALVITLIFMIPCLAVAWGTIAPLTGQISSATMLSLMLMSLITNIWLLVACGIIFITGMGISQVFTLKAQTDFYLQLKKKRLGLF